MKDLKLKTFDFLNELNINSLKILKLGNMLSNFVKNFLIYKIVSEISTILDNTKKSKIEKDFEPNDETGKSYGEAIYFDFKEDYSEYVKVGCVFYGEEFFKKKNWPNHLRLALTSSEFHYWLKDEAN